MEPKDVAAWKALEHEAQKRLKKILAAAELEVPYAPNADTVLVLREPSQQAKKVTAGGIHIPEKYQEEPEPESTGTLVGGGLAALDYFRDHGLLVGDRVQIGRFAGWEKEFHLDQKGENKRKILQMKTGDILGSFDLKERLWGDKPTMEIVYEDGQHWIRAIA